MFKWIFKILNFSVFLSNTVNANSYYPHQQRLFGILKNLKDVERDSDTKTNRELLWGLWPSVVPEVTWAAETTSRLYPTPTPSPRSEPVVIQDLQIISPVRERSTAFQKLRKQLRTGVLWYGSRNPAAAWKRRESVLGERALFAPNGSRLLCPLFKYFLLGLYSRYSKLSGSVIEIWAQRE